MVGMSGRRKRLSRGDGDAMACGWMLGGGFGIQRGGGRRDREWSVPLLRP